MDLIKTSYSEDKMLLLYVDLTEEPFRNDIMIPKIIINFNNISKNQWALDNNVLLKYWEKIYYEWKYWIKSYMHENMKK